MNSVLVGPFPATKAAILTLNLPSNYVRERFDEEAAADAVVTFWTHPDALPTSF